MSEPHELGWHRMGGPPREIGRALGLAGREAVHRHLPGSEYFRAMTGPAHAAAVARMAEATRARFPAIWDEIEGLAEGLDMPVEAVFAWNCRGDLLARVPDGCTTVMVPGEAPVLAHNEDGLPFFRGACFIAEVAGLDAPAFRAFCYPGSIPGHTFAFNAAGLAQTVNNLRLTGVEPDIPRMVLGRAVIGSHSLDQALAVLEAGAGSGGFHFALSSTADRRILSVEFGAGEVSAVEVKTPSAHANHALHHRGGLSAQIVTESSHDRQVRANALLAEGLDPLAILRDEGGAGLPIRRDAADDPDDENTLGTAILRLTTEGIRWSIHDRPTGPAAYSGTGF
ncbi:Acyl-coenzyme A:6-aminopenicillanic acid acyl-transferase [Paracoccus aminovorans]|uniref:Acyl-coenzyme A:6-aminopenicillanic acid acyl-transferase n=1 Tax=Paracoccus aminovorans TaxID=34004 RepID=A0A1I3AQI8_9RHOB|nr:C45 family peptidase [Paracoccus aminovorans]CQR84293.1 6-aminopenicillanic acid acyl-transferase [Paracoccus aminovorans]SFH51631.1 Acyl-coenzyme A:6-aminopenicillanic acid acyl-transferase [Paracoccus aminovorans]